MNYRLILPIYKDKCKVIFKEDLPAAAGVSFTNSHYNLYINTKEVIDTYKDKNGKKQEVLGFSEKMPLQERIGILKHEMLHIILGHVGPMNRFGDRNFKKANYAADCALNQFIDPAHLPDYAITPKNLLVRPEVNKVPDMDTFETYYELMPEPQEDPNGVSSFGRGKTISGSAPGELLDDHDIWKGSTGDPDVQKELTKNIAEQAGNATMKSKGTLPSNYSQLIENLSSNREVNWKQLLRKIVGNKKANSRKTLLRKDRRMPNASWIKGRTKDRIFELAVVSDVSGSVDDKALLDQWGSIIHICETFNTKVTMVQIDTEPTEPMVLDRNTKVLNREKCGGTQLFAAVEKLRECRIKFDALVVTTDGYLFGSDVEDFASTNVPLIWLIDKTGQVMDGMNDGKMTAVQLKE